MSPESESTGTSKSDDGGFFIKGTLLTNDVSYSLEIWDPEILEKMAQLYPHLDYEDGRLTFTGRVPYAERENAFQHLENGLVLVPAFNYNPRTGDIRLVHVSLVPARLSDGPVDRPGPGPGGDE